MVSNWKVRAYREGDIPGIVALINASDANVGLPVRANDEDLRSQFNTPGLNPLRQVVVVEGEVPEMLLGYGRAFPSGAAEDRVYNLSMRVHPEALSRGIELAIADRLVEIARYHETLSAQEGSGRVRVRSYMYERHAAVREAWAQIGMRQVRRSSTMNRDLAAPIDEPQPVSGVRMRTFTRPEDNEGSLRALNGAFADYFDSRPLSLEQWNREMDAPQTKPDLSWLAEPEDGSGEIVGFAICQIGEEENKLQGRLDGWVEGMGTLPEWRNRVIGRSLLLRALRSLKGAGMTAALADVDSEGQSAATRLFESAGFTVRDTMYQYECLLNEIRVVDGR